MDMRDYPPLTHVAVRDTEGVVWSLPKPQRHHHVFQVMRMFGAEPREGDDDFDQGFLDSNGRYLHRKAAFSNAVENDQIKGGKLIGSILTSEDLW